SELFRNRVGGTKSDPVNGACEHVRILADDFERVLAVELVNPARRRAAESVSAQKDGDLAKSRRVAPGGRDQPRARRSDTGNFPHPLGAIVENLPEFVAEVLGDSSRECGTDA